MHGPAACRSATWTTPADAAGAFPKGSAVLAGPTRNRRYRWARVVTLDRKPPAEQFAAARERLDAAHGAVADLAGTWRDLGRTEPFSIAVVVDDNGWGHIDVTVTWPPSLRERADRAAAVFCREVRGALDAAVAAALAVSGALRTPDTDAHRMPLCERAADFQALIDAGGLAGLRPDQARLLQLAQPFADASPADGLAEVRRVMLHLAHMSHPDRDPQRARVAVWAHSADPELHLPRGAQIRCLDTAPAGVLDPSRRVASFQLTGYRSRASILANPRIAFDVVFNDGPWPGEPDDNLVGRTGLLLAAASEWIDALERSCRLDSLATASAPVLRLRPPAEPAQWEPVDVAASPDAAHIAAALDASDIGLATRHGPDGELTVLLRSAGAVYARPVPTARLLDGSQTRGIAVEEATLTAASVWGLPDFVLGASTQMKGAATREVGDGTIMCGSRGLAIQAKSRQAPSTDPCREERWLRKQADKAARQAAGSVRALRRGPTTLSNERGRAITCDGRNLQWAAVVILDHDAPPDDVHAPVQDQGLPTLVLLRRDWDFLFAQLRSVAAVVDYIHRVAMEPPRPLGDEPVRYYELADADERAVGGDPADWALRTGGATSSEPLLPKIPVNAADAAGHAVYRMILEDVATSPFDGLEDERLEVLAQLDRCHVASRAEIGRLLLDRLEGVLAEGAATSWRFRRIVLDDGRLHLAFGVCSQFTDVHCEAFRQWAMLRHHELMEVVGSRSLGTVAVLLTPRFDGLRPWDTSLVALRGDLDLAPDDVTAIRAFWSHGEP